MPAPIHRPSLDQRAAECAADSTVALVVSYDGTPFSGFARQPGQLTVQGELEQALALLLRRPVPVVCSGRTDAGVHGRGQVVSFEADRAEIARRTPQSWRSSLNALVDPAMAVKRVAAMPRGFSARFDAVAREYRYFISTAPWREVLLAQRCWDLAKPLDVDAMAQAARLLQGEHDFKSFCMAASAEGKSTVRCVDSISVDRVEVLGEPLVCITVKGNAFLHSMVRSMVGTLAAVGRGRREPSWVAEVLDARDRQAAGENAPACGLVFWSVSYPDALQRRLDLSDGRHWPWDESSSTEECL